ncbi:MAG: transposase [Proteobacteria bacterium]|nr:transposase [Pseudomonadota bacterium]
MGIKDPLPGSIGFTQRWGSALNLNPHLHILCLDCVFTLVKDASKFQNVETLTDDDTENLLINITTKILKHLRRKGYLNKEGKVVDNPLADGLFTDHESLAQATVSSIAGKIAFGPMLTLRELKLLASR